MVDALLAEPTISIKELADRFGYSREHAGQVVASDIFQSELASRRSALVDPVVAAMVNSRLNQVLLNSLDVLLEKLGNNPTDQLALRAVVLSIKALGMDGLQKPLEAVPDRLQILADRLVALNPLLVCDAQRA